MSDCIYIDKYDKCQKDEMFLSIGDYFEECDSYTDITEGKDYEEKYYKRLRNSRTGIEEKQESKGKKIEMYGLIFYTEEDTRFEKDYYMTEEKTGYLLPSEALKNKDNLEVVYKTIEELIPVKDLPDYVEASPC
jgi:hypothetical protein